MIHSGKGHHACGIAVGRRTEGNIDVVSAHIRGDQRPDLDAGIAYSEVLDTAGHIQKQAQPDTLLVSQQTLEGLPKRLPLSPAGELTGTGPLYRLDRFLSEADLAHGSD